MNYNLDILENLKFNAGVLYTHTVKRGLSENVLGSVLFNALNMDPTKPSTGRAIGLGGEVINPLSQIASTYNRSQVDKIGGNVGLSYNFFDHFTVQSNLKLCSKGAGFPFCFLTKHKSS